jgi:uncharacterized protein (UPF0261 family)
MLDDLQNRNLYIHNSEVTLMRTTAEENKAIGEWIVSRLNQMDGPVRFLLPLGGVSLIDAPGQPFHDPDADQALFAAIAAGWSPAPNRNLLEIEANINDPKFAAAAVGCLPGALCRYRRRLVTGSQPEPSRD